MAYDSRTYRILIASPSDVETERETIAGVIQQWNDLNSFARKVVLLPLRWETHTAPEYGHRPQEVINRMIVDDCDLLVGVFWGRVGTPTEVAGSGTLEEIERAAKAGKPIMLYFSRIGIDPELIDFGQLGRLKALAIQDGLTDADRVRQRVGEGWEGLVDVLVSGNELGGSVLNVGHRAKPIQLRFEDPVAVVERRVQARQGHRVNSGKCRSLQLI